MKTDGFVLSVRCLKLELDASFYFIIDAIIVEMPVRLNPILIGSIIIWGALRSRFIYQGGADGTPTFLQGKKGWEPETRFIGREALARSLAHTPLIIPPLSLIPPTSRIAFCIKTL